jgi:ppGpp synthetase/RelA/SpoT-type nucleotidyltranferase
MVWIVPQHPRSAVDQAGKIITDGNWSDDNRLKAELIVNNWRSSHSFPLNTIQNGLRKRAQAIDSKVIVAQRIKRLESIQQKLIRFTTTRLSQLQDLGGCRAIVNSAGDVDLLVKSYNTTKAQHELIRLDDYISQPQISGYRGVHMVFKSPSS